jgi:hypothetical protein
MRRFILMVALIGCEVRKEPAPESSSTPTTTPSSSGAAPSASPGAASPSGQKSSCGAEILGEEGIGELRIGASVESVRQKCNVVRDTTAPGAEGMPARKLAVALSRDTVEAEIVDGKVWRIAVHSPRLRTADALGVGTSIGRLRQLKEPRGMMGEGQFFVASPQHCGMSFRLANAGPAARGDMDRAGLLRLSEAAAVSQVLIFGCEGR